VAPKVQFASPHAKLDSFKEYFLIQRQLTSHSSPWNPSGHLQKKGFPFPESEISRIDFIVSFFNHFFLSLS
jgi:hypothetical protein